MRKNIKRLLAVLLASVITLTAFTMLSANAAADTQAAVGGEGQVVDPEPEPQPEPPTVGRVTGLGKNTTNTNNINLLWNKVDGATGYVIYRTNADLDNGKYKRLGAVTTTSFNDTKLVQGTPYYYKVAAYVAKDGKMYEGEPTLYKTATQPAKVANIARQHCSTYNGISWSRNSQATGYKIFRTSPESGNKEVLYKTIESSATTSFTDNNVKQGNVYTYKVVAYRLLYGKNYYHSPGSSIRCLAGLCAPNFSVSSSLYKVSLSWKLNRYATRYDVYYSKDKNAKAYTFAGSTTGSSYTPSTRFANGTKLYFRVYPIYKTNSMTVTGTAHTKEITVSNKIYGRAVPSTYVEVSISQQRMWLFKNGKCIVDTPVVTGNRYTADTPKGYFDMYSRATNTVLVGADYASPVDYWMAFSGGCGIHDASWRSSFGGNIYTYNGSHGCVNTPYSAVKKIYNNTTYGTPVIVH